jgi:serine phosphatase RsbU (regulator of sigma subunit)
MDVSQHEFIQSIHNTTSSQELYETILNICQTLLKVNHFQIYFLDDATGKLSLSYTSQETTPEQNEVVSNLLVENLIANAANDFYPNVNKDESSKLVAAYKLEFQGMNYGCLSIHSDQNLLDHAWREVFSQIAHAINPEIIKIQLLESANNESYLSLSKLQGIHSALELIKDLNLETILAKLMSLALKTMNAEVGSIMILFNEKLITKTDFGFSDPIAQNLKSPQGDSYLNFVLAAEDATLILNTSESELIEVSTLSVKLNSILSIPLRVNQQNLGILHIINNENNFDPNSYEVLKSICNLSSYALQNALLHKEQIENARHKESMKIAQNIHNSLLRVPYLSANNIEVFAWSQACDETGGDYFDLLELNENRLEVIIGDASGHGIGAALTMLITRSSLKTLYQQDLPLGEIFNLLNNRLSADTPDEKFMTLFCGTINPQNNILTYCSAGHDGPLLIRNSAIVKELDSTGIPIGMMEGFNYETSESIQLIKGDILILGTDGTWEAMNEEKEEFSKSRIVELAIKNQQKSAQEINEIIQAEIKSFIGEETVRDDMTLIVLKITNDSIQLKKSE